MSAPGLVPLPVVNASGQSSVDISHNKTGFYWDIKQVTVATALVESGQILVSAPLVCSVQLGVNNQPITTQITGVTPLAASGVPSVKLGDHDVMNVVISNAPPNAKLFVAYLYDEVQGQP